MEYGVKYSGRYDDDYNYHLRLSKVREQGIVVSSFWWWYDRLMMTMVNSRHVSHPLILMYKCIKLYIRILHLPRRSHDRYFLVNSNAITIEKRLGLGNSSTETLLPYVNACECSRLAKFTISIKSPLSVELACCSLIIGMTSLQKIVWLLRVQDELIVDFFYRLTMRRYHHLHDPLHSNSFYVPQVSYIIIGLIASF